MNIRMARLLGVLPVVLMALVVATPATAQSAFDAYGYNHDAMIFVGTGDSLDRSLDGTYAGDSTYANDRLTMRWNAEWERGVQEQWSDPEGYEGAWLTHQWNGNVPGGSGELASYKVVWVGACDNQETVKGAGTCIWDQFAVTLDADAAAGGHFWETYAKHPGYGVY
jgi:hypothetical protein